MRIDLTNYEAFLLDYTEGNLNPEMAAELILFMEQHPELEVDLNELSDFTLEAEPALDNNFRSSLKKDENDLKIRFEELCISYYDRSIYADDKKELDFILQQYPHWEKEFEAFEKTYLSIESNILFNGKDALKKEFTYEGSFEHKAVRAMEGEMQAAELEAFEAEIRSNAELAFYWNAFQSSRLLPENSVFQNKKDLYKTKKRRFVLPLFSGYVAIAASIMLVIGIFAIVGGRNNGSAGLSAIKQDTIKVVRDVAIPKIDKPVVAEKSESIRFRNGNKKPVIKEDVPVTEKRATLPQLAEIRQRQAPQLQQLELEIRYLSLSPADLSVMKENPTANNNAKPLSTSQVLLKGVRKILKRNNIEIESPIEDIRENGLAETGMRSLERITRGNVSFKLEPGGAGQRVTGFNIGGLGYSRSTVK